MIVRDIGILIKEIDRRDWNYKFAFPVDTWVRKLAKKLGCDTAKHRQINYSRLSLRESSALLSRSERRLCDTY